MKKYFKYIKPYWIFFVLSPLLMIIEVYCDIQIPLLAARIINEGILLNDSQQVFALTGLIAVHIVFAVCGGVGASYCATRASVYFANDVRRDLFQKIQQFSFANIDDFTTGSLITRLTNDITQLQQLVVYCLRMMFRSPGMLIGSIIMAFQINVKLAFIFIIIVPLLSGVIILTIAFSYKKFDALQEKVDGLNTKVQETLINIRVIKALTRETFENDRFQSVNEELEKAGISAYLITILQMPLMTFFINMASIALLWFGCVLVQSDTLLIGDLSALVTYLAQILISVNMIAMMFLQCSRALVSAKRVSEVLDTDIDIIDYENDLSSQTVMNGKICFENVSFKYYKNNSEDVLENVSFTIEAGQTIGIIGSTGCGKTSLVNLIPRLYDVDSGAVYIDDINVKDYSLKNLRDGVAVILQSNRLFTGSIAENLRWGDKEASMEQLQQVASWASATDFIDNSQFGYDTFIEQGGVNLSGGQKQRLCIARAMLKNPKIFIFDDSTSAVDTATEAVINHHLNNELKNSTKLIIAQRVSSIVHADNIIVMNDGKIEAIGKHDDLINTCLTYQEIFHSQVGSEEVVSNG